MKRILLLLIAIICLFSCEKAPEEIPVSSVTINQPAAEMVVGETVQLSANVLPSNATDKTLTWASSKQSVATVSSDGLVTAIAEGSSTITVTAGDKSASCKVTVEKKVVPVSSVSLNLTELSLVEGEESTLVATVKPNDADDKTVTWKSSDATIVSVNSEGKVSALKAGTATITASAGDKSASCKVTVEKKFIPVTSVTLNKSELSIVEGSQETLVATVKPDDATDKTVTWKSSNTTIVSVSSDGKLSALKEGSATITASAGDKSAACKVTVEKKVVLVTSITLDKTDLTLVEGHEETLVATVKPDNATDKTVTWKSFDASIASVNGEGRVSALKEGSTTITATAGDKSVTCKVTVEQKPKISSLKINDTSFNGLINKYYSISVTVTPSDAQYDLEWSVSNPRVAEIQGGGLSRDIYTKDFGVTEIIVTDKISGKSASITVKTAVTDFEWKESTGSTYSGYPLITIEEGEEYQLHYSCTPSSATHLFEDLSNFVFYEPTYPVDKPTVISIDPEGKVTGLKVGTVGIKPTGLISKKSSGVERVYIKVKARTIAVTEVRLDKSSLTLNIGESAALTATVLPENATDKTVTWKSSDATVVSVTNDGKVSAIKAGTAIVSVLAGDKTAECKVIVQDDGFFDLSKAGEASCYIISKAGKYKFRASAINGYFYSTDLDFQDANSAFLMWDENGAGDILNVELKNGMVYFEKPRFNKGNALISIAKNGTVLWSWHIWSTDDPNFVDDIMDRNLGATDTKPNTEDSYGLLFSFGCPFPFPGGKYKDWTITSEPSVPKGWYVAPGYGFFAADKMPGPEKPMMLCTNREKYGNSIYWRIRYQPGPYGTRSLSRYDFESLLGYEPAFNSLDGILVKEGLFFPASGDGMGGLDDFGEIMANIIDVGEMGYYWTNSVYNSSSIDGRAIWFYEGFGRYNSYQKGNRLLSVRLRKYD